MRFSCKWGDFQVKHVNFQGCKQIHQIQAYKRNFDQDLKKLMCITNKTEFPPLFEVQDENREEHVQS